MTIRIAVNHITEYEFDRSVTLSPHIIRLRPAPHCRTPILSYSLNIKPEDHYLNWQQDPFGNYLARVNFTGRTKKLSVEVELVAEMTVIDPFDFFLEESAEKFPFKYEETLKKDLAPYLEITDKDPELIKLLKSVDLKPKRTIDFLVMLNQLVYEELEYTLRMEAGVQSCEETLKKGSGSCRDYAWVLVQMLRHLGLASRFVSGYLVQLTSDVESLDGPSGPDKDFTDLHAWTEVYIPGAGWVGLDATSGLFAGEGHIPLACTPDAISAAPITGAMDTCEVEFFFDNKVERIHEDPRVTKPYSDKEWQSMMELGHTIDKELIEGDVRLTMGGEPTFVSIDDMEGAEWNTEALSDTKRSLAGDLFMRLQEKFTSGGLMHHGQGKWYPGEPLPRWALSVYWRKDGESLWHDQKLLATEDKDYNYTAKEAKQFTKNLCRRLSLGLDYIIPAYEDIYYYLWKEGTLPTNVDPLDNKLDDPLERKRIRKLFEGGLDKVAGYVLPVKFGGILKKWITSEWPLTREHLYLVPGDSAMGLRLPLDSLPWVTPGDREFPVEADPFEERPPLKKKAGKHTISSSSKVITEQVSKEVIHTALCVEPRNGRLYIFMPPLERIEDYLELVSVIETTASHLKMRVIFEGYEPPQDHRINLLQITPDPGVIEVNIHPAKTWEDLVSNTNILYEEARLTRLGTEKFMLDGRHTGTGGGNHITIGGPTAADSPVLRRPDLLRSLISFWQNHPGLSFLFSGAFIGPTSQSPRVDEARDDSLYELEIAFQQLPAGQVHEPWLVDRILRNLLTDMTGNTHRTEFCVDKLYSPDSASGRRGLVEFRAFEMPPHPQMSLAQMLLLRALVARFWKQPLNHKLVRWGTELHDRFMLPHFVWEDMKDVINDMNQAGYPVKLEWFTPFLEFRFPHYGNVSVQGIELDLHWAIEPWHVLGEEVSAQGTSRYVDSSVERLQVKVKGLNNDRYVVACNGRRVPLRATGTRGEYVAGVRYKAWNPYSSLHPTIPAQQKLVFDIVDLVNNRSIGGCTYFISHPGGRNPEIFPVNANEAESRRNARFWDQGHTQGFMPIPIEEPAGDHPYTLDLRYQAI